MSIFSRLFGSGGDIDWDVRDDMVTGLSDGPPLPLAELQLTGKDALAAFAKERTRDLRRSAPQYRWWRTIRDELKVTRNEADLKWLRKEEATYDARVLPLDSAELAASEARTQRLRARLNGAAGPERRLLKAMLDRENDHRKQIRRRARDLRTEILRVARIAIALHLGIDAAPEALEIVDLMLEGKRIFGFTDLSKVIVGALFGYLYAVESRGKTVFMIYETDREAAAGFEVGRPLWESCDLSCAFLSGDVPAEMNARRDAYRSQIVYLT